MHLGTYDQQIIAYTGEIGAKATRQCVAFASYVNNEEDDVYPTLPAYDEQKLDKVSKQSKNKSIAKMPEQRRVQQNVVKSPIKPDSEQGPLKHLPAGWGIGFIGSKIISLGNVWLSCAFHHTTMTFEKALGKRCEYGKQAYLHPDSHEDHFSDDAFGNMQRWFAILTGFLSCYARSTETKLGVRKKQMAQKIT